VLGGEGTKAAAPDRFEDNGRARGLFRFRFAQVKRLRRSPDDRRALYPKGVGGRGSEIGSAVQSPIGPEANHDLQTVSAKAVVLEREGTPRHVMVVELTHQAQTVGKTLEEQGALDAVRPFLNHDEPPKRLIITKEGVLPK
jgi:hypothetical protein